MRLKERELTIKESETKRSGWTSPAVLALIAATIGLTGNAGVALINGRIEDRKAEYNRVLEMIKVGDPDKAAENLAMLLESGLYDDSDGKLASYLGKRKAGEGAALPFPINYSSSLAPRYEVSQSEINELLSMDSKDAPWMAIAIGEMGFLEVKGPESSQRIDEYFLSTTMPSHDDVPWSSAFVNWVLTQANIEGTGSPLPSSWATWGASLEKPRFGAVIVLKPLLKRSTGHVGFFVSLVGDRVRVLGGNQRNAVTIATFPISSISSIRWPCAAEGCAP
jgi:uncharacterized protein (TIGR02594 family)